MQYSIDVSVMFIGGSCVIDTKSESPMSRDIVWLSAQGHFGAQKASQHMAQTCGMRHKWHHNAIWKRLKEWQLNVCVVYVLYLLIYIHILFVWTLWYPLFIL